MCRGPIGRRDQNQWTPAAPQEGRECPVAYVMVRGGGPQRPCLWASSSSGKWTPGSAAVTAPGRGLRARSRGSLGEMATCLLVSFSEHRSTAPGSAISGAGGDGVARQQLPAWWNATVPSPPPPSPPRLRCLSGSSRWHVCCHQNREVRHGGLGRPHTNPSSVLIRAF